MKILVSYNPTEKTNLENLLNSINANANYTGDITNTAEVLKNHQIDESINWLYRSFLEDPRVVNGGSAQNTLLINNGLTNSDFTELEKTKQELLDEGYVETETI